MARKPPAAVRTALRRHPRNRAKPSVIDGVSARAVSEIQRLESSLLWPGSVADALARWKRAVFQNVSGLLEAATHAGCPCCDPFEPRGDLEQALKALPPKARRELRAKVEPLDEEFRRRTVHDPYTPPDWPWWRRRA
jgi:hypothetical protein